MATCIEAIRIRRREQAHWTLWAGTIPRMDHTQLRTLTIDEMVGEDHTQTTRITTIEDYEREYAATKAEFSRIYPELIWPQ